MATANNFPVGHPVVYTGYVLSRWIGSKLKGRWSKEEHDNFLKGVGLYGRNWDIIMTLYVPTRTVTQIRTHAQKYFKKTENGLPFPEEVLYCHDFIY